MGKIKCNDPYITNPRVIATNVDVEYFSIRVISAYIPTNIDPSREKKELFYHQLERAIKQNKKNRQLLLGCDMNAVSAAAKTRTYFDGSTLITNEDTN